VLGNAESLVEESHEDGLLEYPVYTKPAVWRGLAVPEVLNFYLKRIFPIQRTVLRSVRPVARRMTAMPIPSDEMLGAVQKILREPRRPELRPEQTSSVCANRDVSPRTSPTPASCARVGGRLVGMIRCQPSTTPPSGT
jgi:hypothetical protein